MGIGSLTTAYIPVQCCAVLPLIFIFSGDRDHPSALLSKKTNSQNGITHPHQVCNSIIPLGVGWGAKSLSTGPLQKNDGM